MLNAVAELEPKFRKSSQQLVLLEALLVRFALLDRTLDLEAVLRGIGGSSSGGSAAERPPAPRPPAPEPSTVRRQGVASRETPASVPATAEPARAKPQPSATSSSGRPRLEDSAPVAASAPVAVASPPAPSRRAPAPSPQALDLNTVVAHWDDTLVALRRDRPMIAGLLEHAIPSGVTANGVLTLQLDNGTLPDGLVNRVNELTDALSPHIPGITRLIVRAPEGKTRGVPPKRLTAESVKSDTLKTWTRKKSVAAWMRACWTTPRCRLAQWDGVSFLTPSPLGTVNWRKRPTSPSPT
jgi:DNA polymerase-3 subunit gamma/tau